MKFITKISHIILCASIVVTVSSCHDFIFGNVSVSDEENPLIQKKTPRSGAEIYYGTDEGQHQLPIDRNADVHNPDPKGVFANWYNCLVMFKEGHSHYGGKIHGNNVYTRAAWKQEQYAEIHNTKSGKPEVVIDKNSVKNFLETNRGDEGPNYFRLIGGNKNWGCCLYFYDKEGHLLNDSILAHSDEYQIFFTISDLNEKNEAYKVMDVRYRNTMPKTGKIDGVEAEYFKNKDSFEARRDVTRNVFNYMYRDTWTHADMGDGVRDFFNIKLLAPLTSKDMYDVSAEDQDCVGLKGHFRFDFFESAYGLDEREWPLELSKNSWNRRYKRRTYLLPKLCIAVRVMKCKKGKKAIMPSEKAVNHFTCSPFHKPNEASEWTEIIRFNLPIKIFTSTFDSDPTNSDPYEPFYYHIGREVGLSPEDAFEAVSSSSGEGGLGFDAWFL